MAIPGESLLGLPVPEGAGPGRRSFASGLEIFTETACKGKGLGHSVLWRQIAAILKGRTCD